MMTGTSTLMSAGMTISIVTCFLAGFSIAYSIYIGYLNYKQAKAVELIKETNEILKRIAKVWRAELDGLDNS